MASDTPWEQTEEGKEAFASIGSPIVEQPSEPPETNVQPVGVAVPTITAPVATVSSGIAATPTTADRALSRMEAMGGLEAVQNYQRAMNELAAKTGQPAPYVVPKDVESYLDQYLTDVAALENPELPTYQAKLKFEKETLPGLPKAYQDAYRKGDRAEVQRLTRQYQDEVDQWVKDTLPNLPQTVKDTYASEGLQAALARYSDYQQEQKAAWEKDVLPTLPAEYQDAYQRGDTTLMKALAEQYQEEYDAYLAKFTSDEREEIASGKYQLLDPETGAMVAVTRTMYEEQQAYERAVAAGLKLGEAGFPVNQSVSGPPQHTFTVPDLADYVRDNPEGLQVLADYGFDQKVLDSVEGYNQKVASAVAEIQGILSNPSGKSSQMLSLATTMTALGLTDYERAGMELKAIGGESTLVDSGTGKALSDYEQTQKLWESLPDSDKSKVATTYASDQFRGNLFAEANKAIESQLEKDGNIIGQILLAPVQPITDPISKQITLNEAKQILGEQFSGELTALKSYVDSSGAFDVDRISKALENDDLRKSVLDQTGYASKDDLITGLKYYNSATRVTPKEWAVAGLVAILDALPVAGGILGPVLGRSAASVAARLAFESTAVVAPLSLGALQLPDTIEAVVNPAVPNQQKGLAVAGEALMLLPLVGTAARGIQFLATASRSNYVPLRSMSMEAQTSRVPFTEKQMASFRSKGISSEDIVKAGTDINQQLVSGKKVAEVRLGDTTVKVKNVPYQKDVGLSLFSSTPDITQIERGGGVSTPLVREFYTAAKVAIEPLERSYLTGQRATRPGIIEVRVSDPEIIAKIMPQRKLISGKAGPDTVLEPEAVILDNDALAGYGYRLDPIPGKAGRGVTFDATSGKLDILRFNLSKVTDNPAGLVRTVSGIVSDGGTVGIGDLHNAPNLASLVEEINAAFGEIVIEGDPRNPATLRVAKGTGKGRTVVQLGDSIDRGTAMQELSRLRTEWKEAESSGKSTPSARERTAIERKLLDQEADTYLSRRDLFNRLQDEMATTGNDFKRVLGNHELAYLTDDAISGISYNDITRTRIKDALVADVLSSRLVAAVASDGELYTHAGVSTKVFPEFRGKSASYIADRLNHKLIDAVRSGKYSDKMFARGRTEKAAAFKSKVKSEGGVFWLRPQEAKASELDLGFRQIVGHNPGFGVRQIWGDNFIEADVGRRQGGTGIYTNTPYMQMESAQILTERIPGDIPGYIYDIKRSKLGSSAYARLKKLSDTIPQEVADVDTVSIRKLVLSDATDVPKELVPDIEKYIRDHNGKLYGSFVEWIKVKGATKPHDIDVAFATEAEAGAARRAVARLAAEAGYKAKVTEYGVKIKKSGKWVDILNAVDEVHHARMQAEESARPYTARETTVNGFRMETLGTQAVAQRGAARAGGPKTTVREARLEKLSPGVMKVLSPEEYTLKGRARASLAQFKRDFTGTLKAEKILTGLKLQAMRDTVADVFMGWDGRIYAIERLRESQGAVKDLVRDLERQAKERVARGDTIGAEALRHQREQLTTPEGRDYIYGGIGFWRDIVAGRQNSVKVSDNLARSRLTPGVRSPLIKSYQNAASQGTRIVDNVRNNLSRFSDSDLGDLFGSSRAEISRRLAMDNLPPKDTPEYLVAIEDRLSAVRDIVDRGIEKTIEPYLDREQIIRNYSERLQSDLNRLSENAGPYNASSERLVSERSKPTISEYARESRAADQERVGRTTGVRRVAAARELSPERALRSVADRSRAPAEERVPPEQPPRYSTEPVESRVPRTGRGERTAQTRSVPLPSMRTPYPPEVPPPRGAGASKTVKPLAVVATDTGETEGRQAIPDGSLTWAQGSLYQGRGESKRLVPRWWYLPPPWDQADAISLDAPPIGAQHTDSISPRDTIQVIGRSDAKIPRIVKKDLGWADIEIINGQEIKFASGGEKTDIGAGDPSTGKGISVEDNWPEAESRTSSDIIDNSRVRKKAKRHRRLSNYDYMTTLKGFKF